MLLVHVAGRADTAGELDATALLNDMCRFVGGQVQRWHVGERHVIPSGERSRTDCPGTVGGRPANVCLDVADFVVAEGALDSIEMR